MAEEYQIDQFRPSDAAGIVALYRNIYGDEYPVKSVYDPEAIIRQTETGETYRAVARNTAGEVVGHFALYRSSPPNPELYECGQMLLRHDSRLSDAAFRLFAFSMETLPRIYNIRLTWGEAVCNHLMTQQMSREFGSMETGIEVGLMPGEAFAKALSEISTDTERISALLMFRSTVPRSQTLYLPAVYDETLRFIYAPWNDTTTFLPSTAPLPAGVKTQGSIQTFGSGGVARIQFEKLGEDFEICLARLVSQASVAGALVTQVFFRLTEPSCGAAVRILRRRGFFFGGALPRWFGEDGMLMQQLVKPPDFDKIFLASKRARELKRIIQQDWESVQNRTFGEFIHKRAAEQGAKTALIWPERKQSQTYAELERESERVARALVAAGLTKEDHVAIWAPNVPEVVFVALGCAKVGIPLVFLNTSYRQYDLEYALKQSDTRLLFLVDGGAAGEYIEVLRKIRGRLPKLMRAVLIGDAEGEGLTDWNAFLAQGQAVDDAIIAARKKEVTGDEIFSIQYTSGTTGAPKGAMLSQKAYLTAFMASRNREGFSADDILCTPLPLFHVYGFYEVLAALEAGGSVVLLERFRPLELLASLEKYRATFVNGTPTMFIAALAVLAGRSYDFSAMRGGNMGGAFCPPELVNSVNEKLSAPEFGVLYGSTEALSVLISPPLGAAEKRTGTAGPALQGISLRIVDPATGKIVPVGGQGELCVKSPSLMLGYYRMAEETAKILDADGWYHTGDLACADADGCYKIIGRVKDMLIRGGENISPAEIEEFLLNHPKILDAQVVGVHSEYYGQEAIAFVRLKPGETADVVEMKRYCRQHIAIYKVPDYFFFVDEYPLTVSGKVQKFKLRELAAQLLAELAQENPEEREKEDL